MPKSENQKLKTLYVAKYLWENADEYHGVSANDIIDYLATECDITANRQSIYRDINALRDVFGMDIDGYQGGRYRLLSRQFEYDDILLIIECVNAAIFISEEKTTELIDALSGLCSFDQAEKLKRDLSLCNSVKIAQKGTMGIINTIRTAMIKDSDSYPPREKISFKYMTHTINNLDTLVERQRGIKYIVSPYKLQLNGGYYYLIAFSDHDQAFHTYRVDKMQDVRLEEGRKEGRLQFYRLNHGNRAKDTLPKFGSEPVRVSIRFDSSVLDAVIDKFGTGQDTFYRPDGEAHFVVSTDIDIDKQFFAWIFGFGAHAKVISPEHIIDKFNTFLHDILSLYGT